MGPQIGHYEKIGRFCFEIVFAKKNLSAKKQTLGSCRMPRPFHVTKEVELFFFTMNFSKCSVLSAVLPDTPPPNRFWIAFLWHKTTFASGFVETFGPSTVGPWQLVGLMILWVV